MSASSDSSTVCQTNVGVWVRKGTPNIKDVASLYWTEFGQSRHFNGQSCLFKKKKKKNCQSRLQKEEFPLPFSLPTDSLVGWPLFFFLSLYLWVGFFFHERPPNLSVKVIMIIITFSIF
ncbi:hypothetical protein WN943_001853 [Citrus x changshan-huyou]